MRKWLTLIGSLILLASSPGLAQNRTIDSLKAVVESSPDDSIKVENLIQLSQIISDRQTAIDYGNKANELAVKLNYKIGVAKALKYIGNNYYAQSKYIEAIDYWNQSLAVFEDVGDQIGVSNLLSNLGTINSNQGDDTKALELYLRALLIVEQSEDTLRIATTLSNIGLVYSKKPETYKKALGYYFQALPLTEKFNNLELLGTVTGNIGEVYFFDKDYSTALFYFKRSLAAFEGTWAEPYTLNYLGKVYAKQGEYDQAIEIQQKALALARGIDYPLDVVQTLIGLAETYRLQGKSSLALKSFKEAKDMAQELGLKVEMRDSYEGLSITYSNLSDYKNAYRFQTLLTAIKDTLYVASNKNQLDLIHANADKVKQRGEIDLLTKEQALQEANLQKEKIVKNAFVGGFIVILVIAFVIFRNYRNKVKTNKLLDKQNEEIEGLLLNILPAEVAKELQHEGYATPQNYDSATVLFTDFKGFTQISAGLLPHELIAELNSYFNEFDDIIGQHNLEKIKTIGDAYMCAGGIPSANTTHPTDAVEAGLAIQKYIARKNIKRKEDGMAPWELRVGIHTGPIVAGVVGRKKYAYDIWGDAVNIASRMESNGEANKVNISEATYELVKDKFKCVPRGKISVKGAGDKNMYFVEEQLQETVTTETQVADDII